MLKKLIDGKEVVLNEKEESRMRSFWKMNDEYPLYQGHIAYDGQNDPYILLDECHTHHKKLIEKICENEISLLNEQIDIARENGRSETEFLSKRRRLREIKSSLIEKKSTLDELIASVPLEISHHWKR